MRKIILSNLISLDGYFEGPNGSLDWFKVEKEFFAYAIEMLESVDTILFGRLTYQMMVEHWTSANALENDPIVASKMNSHAKIVFSRTLSSADWNNTTLIKDKIGEETLKLKQAEGQSAKDIVILGSGSIVNALASLGLIDEYRLILDPVILGGGKQLFKGIKDRIDLKLIKTKTLGSGVIILYYEPEKK
jgi:dihydrofolate reductase